VSPADKKAYRERGAEVPILEEYWAGALARVNAEVHTFARLIQHNAQMGTENEGVFARLLERLLPRKYGIGTGMIIDSFDSYSRQTDIVIYDHSDQPTLFAQATELIYPIEAVTASVEIKTRLSHSDIADIVKKTKQLRDLRPHGGASAGDSYNGSLPYSAVLAYGARVSPATIYQKFSEYPVAQLPDLICIINSGLVMCRNGELLGAEPGTLFAGVALRHSRSHDGARVSGHYDPPRNDDESTFDIDDAEYAVESARALLLFLQALTGGLQRRRPPAADVMTLYMRKPVDELFVLEPLPGNIE